MDHTRHPMTGMDAFAPGEIAALVETRGVAKANASTITILVLGVLAGAFIGLGALLSTTILTGSTGSGAARWVAGIGFSLGLILVVVAGAELFTGNNLLVMGLVSRRFSVARLLRNWTLVYVGNLIGATSIVLMVWLAEWWKQSDGAVGGTALTIAAVKTSLPFGVVLMRGVLANALVCLAVWLATGGRSVTDKVIAIVFPISAFVAAGFEHSVANMYFIPIGWLLKREPLALAATTATPDQLASLDVGGYATNLLAATVGNVIGGAVLVGLVYWFVYLREGR